VILEVEVPRGWLRRNRRRLWDSAREVPPGGHPRQRVIRRVIDFAEMAGPSADDGTPPRAVALAAG
jgi:hypothetical protein